MAKPFAKTLLSLIAACVAGGGLTAQEDADQLFNQAVRLLRLNKREEALQKLEECLAADPSHTDAFRIWRETDADVFEMLLAEAPRDRIGPRAAVP